MKKIIGSLFVLILFISCSQFETENSDKENANKQILDSLVNRCKELNGSPDLLQAAVHLKEEASRQKNNEFIAYSYAYILKYYQQYSNKENIADSIHFYGQKAKDYYIKANHPKGSLRVEADLLRWSIKHEDLSGAFIRIFNLVKDVENIDDKGAQIDAYSLLGTAYMLSNSPTEALNAFQKELYLIKKLNSTDSIYILSNYVAVFAELADAAILNKNFDLAITYADSIRQYSNKYPQNINKSQLYIISDLLTANGLLEKNDLKNIEPYIERLTTYSDTIQKEKRTQTYYDIQSSLASYYLNKKEYNKALNSIDEVFHYYMTSSNYAVNLNSSKSKKADILANLGKFEEAYNLKSDVLAYNDSLAKKNATRQLSEMYTIYEVDRLEKQAIQNEAKAHYSQIVATSSLIVCALLILLIFIIRLNSEKLKKKNEKIFEQYKNMDKFRETITNSTLTSKDSASTIAKELSLFEKIENYLQNNQSFREHDITRESLALQIGTNREYLTRAIQENVNMTFSEYINHYRLEYARQLLIGHTNLSIENIYTSAGFTTKSTFYRLFKEKYSLTPKELRDIALEEMSDKY